MIIVVIAAMVLIGLIIAIFFLFASLRQPVVITAPTSTPGISSPTPSPASTASPVVTTVVSPLPVQTSAISIRNFVFDPAKVMVNVGTTVVWTNNDNVPHTVTSDPNGAIFASPAIQPGETFSATFKVVGNFPYHCSIHPNMQGTIVVTE